MLLYSKPEHDYIIATRGDLRLMTTNSAVLRRIAALVGLAVIEIEW
jgi:hypothetical protein